MRNYYILKKLLLLILLIGFSVSYSQTEEQKKQILANYDLVKLQKLHDEFSVKNKEDKEKAIKVAKTKGWPIIEYHKDGTFSELQRLRIDGTPVYYSTYNTAAAKSTRANFLHNGGGLGLNVEGQGMTAYVWDGGPTRTTHEDYSGRVSIGDYNTTVVVDGNGDHAQHVTGTIIGLGLSTDGSGRNSKGMAPQANAITHEWNNDLTEATAAAANGMLVSNHSYGSNIANVPDWAFGAYTGQSQAWDNLLFNAPYYLMVAAAGNDGNNNNNGSPATGNANPLGGNTAYDKLSGNKTAKNNMVVANGQDANIAANGSLNSVIRNGSSTEGPADDLRIKPDIMGNGTSLYSAGIASNSAYSIKSGTSMASPNVCGSLLLLQQHYNNVNGVFMRAATLKGLALHTADDTETNGPDANTGWGLMNTKVAAETITNNGLQSWVSEETLSQGETFTMTIQSDGTSPLLASVSWTDPITGGYTNGGVANEGTAALVNDLDIRISQGGGINYPWKLTGVNTNTNANGTDNTVDPYERVDVNGASGTYTVTVTHKGTLTNGAQKFSLILTGLSSNFAMSANPPVLTVCSSNDAIYNFDYQQIGGGTTIFSATDLPAGVTFNTVPGSMTSNGSFNAVFGNLSGVPAGTYNVKIIGDNGSESETRNLSFKILHSDFGLYPQSLTSPINGTTTAAYSQTLTWQNNLNAEDYLIEIATDPSFNTIISTDTVTSTSYSIENLNNATVYYWRVRPNNQCSNGNYSATYSFQTATNNCTSVIQTNDTLITDQTTVTSTVNYPTSLIIGDLNVTVDYTHTWIGDVSLTLISPSGTRVTLVNINTCSFQTNLNLKFNDGAVNTINCNTPNVSYPTLHTFKPVTPLSAFNGEVSNGTWTLEIIDGGPGDTGTVNEWALEICDQYVIAGTIPNFVNNGLTPDTNSTYITVTGDIEATTTSETATQQAYTLIELPTKGVLLKNTIALAIGDTFTQDDVNTSKITYTNTEITTFVDQFKVDISNAVSGWLPNQIIPINATLGVIEFNLNDLVIFPNPSKGEVNIQIQSATNTDVKISLFDIQGRKVFKTSKESNSDLFNTTLDFRKLANGMYLIDIQQGNKKTTKQIIINN